MYRPDTLDIEVATLSFMLDNGKWAPTEIAHIRRQLEDRKAQIASGLGSMSQIYWTLTVQRDVDKDSRVRHDPIHGWMLDRWVEDPGCWHPIGYIGTEGRLQDGIVVDDKVRPDLVAFLKAHDMQRPGYFLEKAAKSAAIRLENEKKATQKVLMAVDSLSDKRLKEFIAVEKAIQTGDTVTMHGETFRQFEAMTEAGKKAPPGPESINPGLHPQVHKRDYSKGEGESYGK
jgi:hypothetical protein